MDKKKQSLACQYSAITNTIMSSTINRKTIYRKTDDDKQACIIEFVLFSILSTNL